MAADRCSTARAGNGAGRFVARRLATVSGERAASRRRDGTSAARAPPTAAANLAAAGVPGRGRSPRPSSRGCHGESCSAGTCRVQRVVAPFLDEPCTADVTSRVREGCHYPHLRNPFESCVVSCKAIPLDARSTEPGAMTRSSWHLTLDRPIRDERPDVAAGAYRCGTRIAEPEGGAGRVALRSSHGVFHVERAIR